MEETQAYVQNIRNAEDGDGRSQQCTDAYTIHTRHNHAKHVHNTYTVRNKEGS